MSHAPLPPDAILIGIDVAKAHLDLARSDTGEIIQFPNDDQGIKQLLQSLEKPKPHFIIVEATGGYERQLVNAALMANLPIAVANPRHVRHFAIALGILAKTDAIDAQLLIEYARHIGPRLAEKRRKNQDELDALVTCRRQLLQVRTEQTNRLQQTHSTKAKHAIKHVLKSIDKQIKSLDQQIQKLIEDDDDFNPINRIIRSMPGVGPVLAATLLAQCRELGNLDRRQIAALIGVAPYNKDSGKRRGKRAIAGGRTHIRCTLYMAALSAMRYNLIIKSFTQKLKAQGKPNKVAIVAAMRKMLTLLNAMVRDNLQWNQLKINQNP